jgi:CubicO group peptidase (beta-lactamase class C family)
MLYVAVTSLCMTVFASSSALAQSAAQIDAVVLDEMAKQNIVGMAVGIVKNGNLYFAKGYGHTDLARTEPVTTNTIFRWGSISKTLTATATLKLAEENPTFSLNDKVTEHVRYWPEHGNKGNIRVKHLLSNRSGIIHYKEKKHCPDNRAPGYARNKHTSYTYNARQAVEVFKNQHLCFDPGTGYKYSTFGYSLLGSAIEGAADTSYENWVRDTIKTPLGMSSLRQATGTRRGFDQRCHILQEVPAGNSAWKLPGGGWESSIIDLAKFGNALLHGNLLNDTSRLWTRVPGNSRYGYGIYRVPGTSQVWNGGKHDNSRAQLYLYPGSADRLGIVLMINGVHSNPMRISHHLADLFGQNHNDNKTPVVKTCENSCSGKFSALWSKTGKDVLLRRGYSHDNFYAEWKLLRQAGYYTDDFEPYVQGGSVYWDAVFRKGPGANAMVHDIDFDGFSKKWKELSSIGYRLVDLETYSINGRRHWAGLFRPGRGKYAMQRGLTTNEFAARRKDLAKQGLKIIDTEPYPSGGELNWAGVWRAGKDGLLNYNLSTNDFEALRTERLNAGYKLIDIETYKHHGNQLWAAIWEKSSIGEKWNANYMFCGTKSNSETWNSMGITNRHKQWREQAYELMDWERD